MRLWHYQSQERDNSEPEDLKCLEIELLNTWSNRVTDVVYDTTQEII